MCLTHGAPMDEGDHSECMVELLACPEHREAQVNRMADSRQKFDQEASEFGFKEKAAKFDALADGRERNALLDELLKWMFPGW